METSQTVTTGVSSGGITHEATTPWSLRSALRAPELWLIVALAAALRLWHIGVSLFLGDQAELMRMARLSIRDGLIPVTGIPSSIGTLNPPASIFALLPFAALGSDPLPAVIATALWNVLGVGLAYLFARRYFGRIVATLTALLFAVGGAAVWYSRFIWQQNLLPPVVLLWAVCAFAGATQTRDRRLWLAPAVGCAVIATQLHPTAVIFLLLTVIALLLAPQRPRWLDWLLTAVVVVVLLLPTIVFEKLSGGHDVHAFKSYLGQGSHVDLSVGRALWGILDGPNTHSLSSHGLAHELTSPAGLVTLALSALIAAGYVLLTVRVARPVRRAWRAERTTASAAQRLLARSRALWNELRRDPAWKVNLLLWLWLTVPIVALIRHSSLVADHYLMTLYPAIFLPAALIVARVWRSSSLPHLPLARGRGASAATPEIGSPSPRRGTTARAATLRGAEPRSAELALERSGGSRGEDSPSRRTVTLLPSLLLLALVAVLVIGQSARDFGYYTRLASGSVNQFATYGYPLDALRTLDQRLDTLARQIHARSVEIVEPQSTLDPQIVEYLLADGRANRLSFPGACLLLPAPANGPALIAASSSAQPALSALAQLPGATHLADIPTAGTAPWTVYEVPPSSVSAGLPGDHPVVQATFRDAAGNAVRLDAAARDGGMLRLRWTALAITNPPYGGLLGVSLSASVGGATAQGGCQTQQWRAGQTFYTWLSLPASGSAPSDVVTLRAGDQILGPTVYTFAGLHLLTGSYFHFDARGLFAQAASDSGLVSPETIQSDGSYTLPLSALGN